MYKFLLLLVFLSPISVGAVDVAYDFEFANTATRLEHDRNNVVTGSPWYVWWDDSEICDTGNATLTLHYATGTQFASTGSQQCNESGTSGIRGGGMSLLGNLTGQPAGTYTFKLTASSSPTITWYDTAIWDGSTLLELDPTYDITKILSISPEHNSTTTVGTTTISVEAYVNENDVSGFPLYKKTRINVFIEKQPYGEVVTWLDYVSLDSGYYATSTQIYLEEGNYIVNAYLETGYIGGVFDPTRFISLMSDLQSDSNRYQYSQFIVGIGTLGGNIFQNAVDTIQGNLDTATSTTFTGSLDRCNPLNFDASLCFSAMFLLNQTDVRQLLTFADQNILTRVPLGYVNRFYQIANETTATTTVPSVSYTFRDDSPIASGLTLDLNFSDILDEAIVIASTTLTTQDGSNYWDVMEQPVRLFVFLTMMLIMLNDIVRIRAKT